jgi:hypothetical protein
MMLERLDFWLAVFTLGALVYFELRLGRFIGPLARAVLDIARPAAEQVAEQVKRRSSRQLPTTVRLKPRPVRKDNGRFDGSLPADLFRSDDRSEAEPRSEYRSAIGSDGTVVPEVPGGTISPDEAALIGLRLGRGMSTSDVAKSLPGYSARKYQEYREKVLRIKEALADLEPAEDAQELA